MYISNSFYFSENCDFEFNTCGWIAFDGPVNTGRFLLVCGIMGDLENCRIEITFQDTNPWKRKQIGSIYFDCKCPISW